MRAVPTRKEMVQVIKDMCTGKIKTKNGPYEGIRETKGKNRDPQIDAIILRQGGSLGQPYCQWGMQEILDELCDYYGVSRKSVDIPEGGGTQDVYRRSPERFKHAKVVFPSWRTWKKGNTGLGHVEMALETISEGLYKMFGFNTSVKGSEVARDGEGCGFTKRPHDPAGSLSPVGYIDIYAAIKEAMTGEKTEEPQDKPTEKVDYSWRTEVMQVKLVALGYKLSIDGIMGPETREVMNQFQKKHLGSVGEIGPKTLKKLDDLLKDVP